MTILPSAYPLRVKLEIHILNGSLIEWDLNSLFSARLTIRSRLAHTCNLRCNPRCPVCHSENFDFLVGES
jgi:hypothetical protein